MNEEQKNIETCLPENILDEVANVPKNAQFVSLTDEALDPLKQQALQQEGYDGYEKVVWTHKPYTFTSSVKQMKSNLILLLRRLWRFPFGRGTTVSSAAATIRSLADMWQHYITRLKGNDTYGIPSRLDQLTDLTAAPALLADRKIGGVIGAPDGISLAQLLCSTSAVSSVTEIVDDNVGWTLTKSISFENIFQNSNKVQLGCREIRVPFEHDGGVVFGSDEEYKFTALKKITPSTAGGFGHGIFNGDVQSHDIDLGDTEEIAKGGFFGLIRCYGSTTDYRYALIARKLRKCSYLFSRYNDSQIGITKVVLGKIETNNFQPYYIYGSQVVRTPNLINLEFGQDTAVSLNLKYWNPSVALDASRTDLIEEGSTATNNLQQFLSNFKTYIAERLTDNGSGLTITLSQAVRDAIQQDPEIVSIITGKGWTISPAPSV